MRRLFQFAGLLAKVCEMAANPFGVLRQFVDKAQGVAIEEVAAGIDGSQHHQDRQKGACRTRQADSFQQVHQRFQHESEQDRNQQRDQDQLGDIANGQNHGGPDDNLSHGARVQRGVELALFFLFQLFFRELAVGGFLRHELFRRGRNNAIRSHTNR